MGFYFLADAGSGTAFVVGFNLNYAIDDLLRDEPGEAVLRPKKKYFDADSQLDMAGANFVFKR